MEQQLHLVVALVSANHSILAVFICFQKSPRSFIFISFVFNSISNWRVTFHICQITEVYQESTLFVVVHWNEASKWINVNLYWPQVHIIPHTPPPPPYHTYTPPYILKWIPSPAFNPFDSSYSFFLLQFLVFCLCFPITHIETKHNLVPNQINNFLSESHIDKV